MESVMNFLAANYIWFFVLAGILCFALVGFVIDSKRKKKEEFKGESIDTSSVVAPDITGETVDLGVEVPFESMSAPEPAPVQTMEVPEVPAHEEEPVQESTVNQMPIENTMQINDIPMNIEEEANLNEVPVNPELQNINSEPITFGEPISTEPVEPVNIDLAQNVMPSEEVKPEDNGFEMFEDLK